MSLCADLARAFLDETLQDSPVLASQLGVDGFADRLDDLSEAAFEDRRRRSRRWLQKFEEVPDAACATFDERLDRDLIRSTLRGRTVLDDWLMWRRQPETYLNVGLAGVFTLFLRRLKPEAGWVEGAVARLRAIPSTLESGRRDLRGELAPREYVAGSGRGGRVGL